jgi:diguanylate cyclase (GGDEF)-like protein
MPPRLLAVVVPVCAAGFGVAIAAAVSLATEAHTGAAFAGIGAFFAASMLSARFPVPLDGLDTGGVSLGFVFAVGAIVLFGWDAGVLVAFAAPTLAQVIEHRPPARIAFNAGAFALSAGTAGALAGLVHGNTSAAVVAQVVICASAKYVLNMTLVTGAVAASSRRPFSRSLVSTVRSTGVPFGLMASAALILVVLWEREPALSAALIGPLLAIGLYQRSTYNALRAMRLALTDPLTGLGNHRHFQDRLERELVRAQEQGAPLTLCLVDVDDFKRVNDRFGHPAGDRILTQIATRLRQDGETFRLGGDEFALLLPGCQEHAGVLVGEAVVDRIAAVELDQVGSVTVSAGVATFPVHASGRDELIRLADGALYWAKEYGKNRVRASRPDVVELAELKRLASGPDRAARFRAAASLARAVDERDAYTGSHSERVAELSARIADRLGLSREEVEFTRLAASLHDLGKLAIPEDILRKPGPLTDAERLVLERHPQIGFRMLETLGVSPVADSVLHHHERWDGAGYPDGLPEHKIPLGARIIFVADAYDAMTSDRVYRNRLSPLEAMAELERCAGTQFDPGVVEALAEELELVAEREPALALYA